MTREAMTEQLENAILLIKQNGKDYLDERDIPMLETLIQVLQQKPCEDAISRQVAIDALGERPFAWTDSDYETGLLWQWQSDVNAIKALPPVQPQPKIGKWITQWSAGRQKEYYYCSECREEFSYDGETGIKMNDYRYCPNCASYNGGNDNGNK